MFLGEKSHRDWMAWSNNEDKNYINNLNLINDIVIIIVKIKYYNKTYSKIGIQNGQYYQSKNITINNHGNKNDWKDN